MIDLLDSPDLKEEVLDDDEQSIGKCCDLSQLRGQQLPLNLYEICPSQVLH